MVYHHLEYGHGAILILDYNMPLSQLVDQWDIDAKSSIASITISRIIFHTHISYILSWPRVVL